MRRKIDHRENLKSKNKKELRCQCCEQNTLKRIVVKRFPLEDITEDLPGEYRKEGYKEFLCTNEVRLKGRDNKWSEGTCENHMIRQLKLKGDEGVAKT